MLLSKAIRYFWTNLAAAYTRAPRRSFYQLFNNKETNPKGAQLIVATHDTNLLNAKSLRRDQVWFTEKDERGATHLYPLTDIETRKGDNLEKGYLQGRYGAIPFAGPLAHFVKSQLTHGAQQSGFQRRQADARAQTAFHHLLRGRKHRARLSVALQRSIGSGRLIELSHPNRPPMPVAERASPRGAPESEGEGLAKGSQKPKDSFAEHDQVLGGVRPRRTSEF